MGTDFKSMMEPVARRLWGDPSDVGPNQLRWGNSGSKSVSLLKGTWFDYEADKGGGVIDLVEHVEGVNRDDALSWLRKEGFLEAQEKPREARPAQSEPSPQSKQEPQPVGKREAVATYDYTDNDGNLLYQVRRMQMRLPDGSFARTKEGAGIWKTFRQAMPDGQGNWVLGITSGDYMREGSGDWFAFDDAKFDAMRNGQRRHFDGPGHTIYRHQQVEIALSENRTIYLCEGEKDVHTIEGWGLIGTTNSGGAKGWGDHLANLFRDGDVVVLVDNDEAGIERGETVALSLRKIAKRVRVLNLADHFDLGTKADVTDWKEAGGTLEAFQLVVEGCPNWRPRRPKSAFGAVGLHQLSRPDLEHDYLIDGFLERKGVAIMPGASGSGKSFAIIEMGMCIALGRDFWGMPVKQGLVMYQAGEGQQGLAKRLQGWALDRGIPPSETIPFESLMRKINLFVDDKDCDAFIDECRRFSAYHDQPIRMVVIDTLNKAMTGANENSGQDMGKVIARLERIRDELDCAVVVPHHMSKQGSMRGHTSLLGDVSNVIRVDELQIRDRNGRTIRTVTLDKNKDGEKGRPLRFVLRQVVLEIGSDGKNKTTCVVDRPDGSDEELVDQGKLSLTQALFMRDLKDAIAADGTDPEPGYTLSAGRKVVLASTFYARLRKGWTFRAPETDAEGRAKEFQKMLVDTGKLLKAKGYIDRDNDKRLIWWTGKDDRVRVTQKPAINPELKKEFPNLGKEELPF